MVVSTTNNRMSYAGDGSNTVFAYTFKIFADTDLVVKLRDTNGVETLLTLTTDYTVSGAGDASGGNVTTVATYASGNTLIILRQVPLTQLVDYVENDAFLAETHEGALDRTVMITQQLEEILGRAIKLGETSPLSDVAMPDPVANGIVAWDAAANALTLLSATTASVPDFDSIDDHNDDLAQAISDIGASDVTLVITKQVNVTADATVPSNIELWFLREGSFNISAGKTVTIQGGLLAGLNQIFEGSGSVDFSGANIRQVSSQWWTDFATCISAIGAGEAKLIISSSEAVTGNVTVPTTLGIEIVGAGELNISNGITVTFNGPFNAELRKIFIGAGTVEFGQGYISDLYPQWWGAVVDGTTDDSTAINAAAAAAVNGDYISRGFGFGRRVVFTPGHWRVGTSIIVYQGITYEGFGAETGGAGGTTLELTDNADTDAFINDPAIDGVTLHYARIKSMAIDGNKANNASGNGIKLLATTGEGFKLEDLFVRDFAEDGIQIAKQIVPFYAENLHLFGNDGSGIRFNRPAAAVYHMPVLMHISGDDNGTALIEVTEAGGSNFLFIGVKAETNTSGKQPNAILLNDMGDQQVTVIGLSQHAGAGLANAAIKITGATGVKLHWTDVRAVSTQTDYIIDDVVNSIQIAAGAAGNSPSSSGYLFDPDFRGGIRFGGGTKIAAHLTGTKSWNSASLPDGSTDSTTVTVTGAAVGDTVTVGLTTLTTEVVQLTGHVSAADTVTVVLTNHSGGTINLASGTLRADVWQH